MMLEAQKTGNKSLELILGCTHSQFFAEVESQLETESTGPQSRVSKSSPSVKLSSRELSRAKWYREFLTDLYLTQISKITTLWAVTKWETTTLQAWWWVSKIKESKWLGLKIVTSSCTIKTRGKIAGEILIRGSSRTKEEHSSSSNSSNNKIVRCQEGRMQMLLAPKEAQMQEITPLASSRKTPTMETSAWVPARAPTEA